MKEIKRIDVMSYAKIYAVIFAVIGLIAGLIFAAVGSFFAEMSGASGLGNFGALSIIVFPLLYGGIGFVAGLITAGIYNLLAGWVGGIRIELQDVQ